MKQLFYSLMFGMLAFNAAFAGGKDPVFTKTASGMQYYMAVDVKGENAVVGKYVSIHIHTYYKDSLIFDSRTNNKGESITFPLSEPRFHGDLSEAVMMMSPGDSMILKVSVDSILAGKQKPQPWMKPGNFITYYLRLESVKTQEQINRERDIEAAKQNTKDVAALSDYLTKNNIKAERTASGIYYTITKKGTGANPKESQTVYVNYTGRTLDGNVFDSNIDPKFGHVEAFSFPLGRGRVIRGWDEGIALLNKGAKATLYIPSNMAYGENSPNAAIPPNSILIFDVELIDIK